MGALLTLWMAYVLTGVAEGQGLVGWVASTSIRLTGSASDGTNILLATAVGAVPLGLAGRLAARALGVRLVPGQGAPGTPRGSVLGGVGLLVATGVLVAATLPREDGRSPARLDLDGPGQLTLEAGPVGLVGSARRDRAVGYRETRTSSSSEVVHTFIPLTASAWTPATPVRVVLVGLKRSDEAEDRGLVARPEPDGRTRYFGTLRRDALPAIARDALEHQGVTVADPCWVLSSEAPRELAMLIGAVGISLAAALIITGLRASRGVRAH